MNYVTRKQYRGINIVLLAGNPYTSPYYLSFKQVNQRGGRIGSGEPGHPVVFYKPVADRDDGETSYMVMRFYREWNIQQTTLAIPETDSIHTRPAGLSLMDGMPDKPQIVHGQVNPCYIPSETGSFYHRYPPSTARRNTRQPCSMNWCTPPAMKGGCCASQRTPGHYWERQLQRGGTGGGDRCEFPVRQGGHPPQDHRQQRGLHPQLAGGDPQGQTHLHPAASAAQRAVDYITGKDRKQ
jgi:hypothetical protein